MRPTSIFQPDSNMSPLAIYALIKHNVHDVLTDSHLGNEWFSSSARTDRAKIVSGEECYFDFVLRKPEYTVTLRTVIVPQENYKVKISCAIVGNTERKFASAHKDIQRGLDDIEVRKAVHECLTEALRKLGKLKIGVGESVTASVEMKKFLKEALSGI